MYIKLFYDLSSGLIQLSVGLKQERSLDINISAVVLWSHLTSEDFYWKKTETKSSRNFHVPSSYCRLHTQSQILTQHKFYDNFRCLFKFRVHAQQHCQPPKTFLLVCMERVPLICLFHVACCSLIESMFYALLCILTESTQRPLLHRLAHKQNRADAQSADFKCTLGFSKYMTVEQMNDQIKAQEATC